MARQTKIGSFQAKVTQDAQIQGRYSLIRDELFEGVTPDGKPAPKPGVQCFHCKRVPDGRDGLQGTFSTGRGMHQWICSTCLQTVAPNPAREAAIAHEAKLAELGVSAVEPDEVAIEALTALEKVKSSRTVEKGTSKTTKTTAKKAK